MKPKLIAFDLDYTLWPFWVDTHVTPPFHKNSKGIIKDAMGSKVTYFKEVPSVLKELCEDGYLLAAVSRTSEINGANDLLQLFDWDKYFSFKEIYPGVKITHFKKIKADSGIDFKDMLFFDDEYRNIKDLKQIGVLSILVEKGVTRKVVEDGLLQYEQVKKGASED